MQLSLVLLRVTVSLRATQHKRIIRSCANRYCSTMTGGNADRLSWESKSPEEIRAGDYCWEMSDRMSSFEKKLVERTYRLPMGMMAGAGDELQLLGNMIWAAHGKKIVDLGTFTGVSALHWALCIPDDGKVFTIDMSRESLDAAKGEDSWREAGVWDKIEFLQGAGEDVMTKLVKEHAGTVDFIFLDADHSNYSAEFELALHLLRPRGVMAFDNTMWGRSVLGKKTSGGTTGAMQKFNASLTKDQRIHLSFLPMADGCTICWKK